MYSIYSGTTTDEQTTKRGSTPDEFEFVRLLYGERQRERNEGLGSFVDINIFVMKYYFIQFLYILHFQTTKRDVIFKLVSTKKWEEQLTTMPFKSVSNQQ